MFTVTVIGTVAVIEIRGEMAMIVLSATVRKVDPQDERFPDRASVKRGDGSIMGFRDLYLCEMQTRRGPMEAPFFLDDALLARMTTQGSAGADDGIIRQFHSRCRQGRSCGLMDFAEIELGPRMQALPERERKFVWFYLTNEGPPNGAQAAREAGYSDSADGAKVRAHALMHRGRGDPGDGGGRPEGIPGVCWGPAVRAAAQLIGSEKHPGPSKAVFTTLARLGLGEKSSVDVNVSGTLSINHTDQALNDQRVLVGLGVSREKLVEVFGFSGVVPVREDAG